jgi:adenylate cyclase
MRPVVEWLIVDGWRITDTAELLDRFAQRVEVEGLPLLRLLVFVRSLHPQVAGIRYTWRRERSKTEVWPAPHGATLTAAYRDSPIAALLNGEASCIRRRLDISNPRLDYPILEDLLSEGATDYVALPMVFSNGDVSVVSFATDRAGGFSHDGLAQLRETLLPLARLIEIHAVRRTADAILDTYLGRHTGKRVREGLIKRGDGDDIHAVIWFCDLRDSTVMADTIPRTKYLRVLNEFFDCMAGAVLAHGGEVLRFIGDAALAIFPTGPSAYGAMGGCCSRETACHAALDAAMDARARVAALNHARTERGEPALRYGLALHMGNVLHGNIGVPERLEFTVVGAAANEAARLEGLCKTLGEGLLISGAFRRCFPGRLVSLGRHTLRGVAETQEVFTLPEKAEASRARPYRAG